MNAPWHTQKVDGLCEITSSKRIFAADYQTDGVPFYRGKEIIEKSHGALSVSTDIFITKESFEKIKAKFGAPAPGDLLLTSVGTLGVPYVVKSGERFYFKDGNLTWFRNLHGIDPRFLYYWLISPDGKAELKKCTIGSSQPAFTIVLLKGMEIALPPRSIQKRISTVLSAYDDLIENNTCRIQILEEMARALYREWFVKFRFPGYEGVEMIEAEHRRVPHGWRVVLLRELLESTLGGDWGIEEPDTKENCPTVVIRGTDFDDVTLGSAIRAPTRYITDASMSRRGLKIGDLVIENSVNAQSRCIGRSLLVTDGLLRRLDTNAICASFCKNYRLKNPHLAPLIHMHLKHLYDTGRMKFYQNIAANGIGNFQSERFANSEFIVLPPSDAAVDRAVAVFTDLTSSTLANQIYNLRHTRDLLLPKLVSGEVDVSDLDIATAEAVA